MLNVKKGEDVFQEFMGTRWSGQRLPVQELNKAGLVESVEAIKIIGKSSLKNSKYYAL